MFEIRDFSDAPGKPPAFMTSIDGIHVPVRVLDEAEQLSDEHKKTFFIGVVEKFDATRNEAKALFSPAELLLAAWRPIGQYIATGEYVISDDRDEVLAHGCGRLVWVTPKIGATVHDKLNAIASALMDETTVATGHSSKNANTPQLMTICANILAQTNFFDEGHALSAKAVELERLLKEL